MATQQKRSRTRARLLVRQLYLGCFVIAISTWIFIAFYTVPDNFEVWQISSVKFLFYSPRYLSINDENSVRIGMENTQDQAVNVTVQLVNNGTSSGFLGSESNFFYSGVVQGHEQINRQLLVFFPLANNGFDSNAGLILQGSVDAVTWDEELEIRIAPLPRIRFIAKYLNGIFLAVVGSAAGLINDILRQSLQPARKK